MKRFAVIFSLWMLMVLAGCAGKCETCGGRPPVCPVCEGVGACADCDASGEHICPECYGDPECFVCEDGSCPQCGPGWTGMPNPICELCDGSGRCYECNGQGIVRSYSDRIPDRECYTCYGRGTCKECRGTGRGEAKAVTCRECGGTELCSFCGGTHLICTDCTDGKVPCPHAGKCANCDGTGSVDCPDC